MELAIIVAAIILFGVVGWFMYQATRVQRRQEQPAPVRPTPRNGGLTPEQQEIQQQIRERRDGIRRLRAARGPLGGAESVDDLVNQVRTTRLQIQLTQEERRLNDEVDRTNQQLERMETEFEEELAAEEQRDGQPAPQPTPTPAPPPPPPPATGEAVGEAAPSEENGNEVPPGHAPVTLR